MSNYKVIVNTAETIKVSILTENNVGIAYKNLGSGLNQDVVFELDSLTDITVMGERSDGKSVSYGKVTPISTASVINSTPIKSRNDLYFETNITVDETVAVGDRVALKVNNHIEKIKETITDNYTSTGSEMYSNTVYDLMCVYDSYNNRYVVFYRTGNATMYATVCSIDITTEVISVGTPVSVATTVSSIQSVVFDPINNKVIVFYYHNVVTKGLKAIAGTVSNLTISFGTQASIKDSTATTTKACAAYDTTNNKIGVFYSHDNVTLYGKAVTVSGSSITSGTEATISNAESLNNMSVEYNPSVDRFLIVTGNSSYNIYLRGVACYISGTSILYGSMTTVRNKYNCVINKIYYDTSYNKFVIIYRNGVDNLTEIRIVDISGTTVTPGTIYTSSYALSTAWPSFKDGTTNKFYIYSMLGYIITVQLTSNSTMSLSYTSSSVFSNMYYCHLLPSTTNECFFNVYNPESASPIYKPYTRLYKIQNIINNLSNFYGISQDSKNSGQTATIIRKGGIASNFSGLTVDADYWVTGSGTLVTSAPERGYLFGKAIDTQRILLKQ